MQCDEVLFPVALAPNQAASYTVVAHLCSRGPLDHKTIQVLVHGATSDHTYWNWPLDPQLYSYVRAMTSAGFATLDMDRVGHGQSSRVADGAMLDLGGGAFALHQIIQDLRAGTVVTTSFGTVHATRVLLVGESIAGNMAWLEAGTYHDVDGLVVAGSAHTFASGFQDIVANTIPVQFDPILGPQGFPPNYFTTAPGSRSLLFYYTPNADPAVIALDEATKQTVTLGELISVGPTLPVSQQVNVPTLITIGDHDHLFCEPPSCTASGTQAHELDNWSCAELAIVPDTGHDLNLHRNAPTYFSIVRSWAVRQVGGDSRVPQNASCGH